MVEITAEKVDSVTVVGSSGGKTFVELNIALEKVKSEVKSTTYLVGSFVVLHGIPFDFMV